MLKILSLFSFIFVCTSMLNACKSASSSDTSTGQDEANPKPTLSPSSTELRNAELRKLSRKKIEDIDPVLLRKIDAILLLNWADIKIRFTSINDLMNNQRVESNVKPLALAVFDKYITDNKGQEDKAFANIDLVKNLMAREAYHLVDLAAEAEANIPKLTKNNVQEQQLTIWRNAIVDRRKRESIMSVVLDVELKYNRDKPYHGIDYE